MEQVKKMLAALGERLAGLAKRNAVVAKPLSVGDRHVVPLCELTLGLGGGGGTGEGTTTGGKATGPHKGTGGGVGGAAKAVPVAVVIIEGGKVRLESLGQ
ncbi:MAG: hypothetical protein HY907_01340 [Deltaproteobacteria bacterium]|nr:hypothetical protein [Deltaproteobacteria bacterium]